MSREKLSQFQKKKMKRKLQTRKKILETYCKGNSTLEIWRNILNSRREKLPEEAKHLHALSWNRQQPAVTSTHSWSQTVDSPDG